MKRQIPTIIIIIALAVSFHGKAGLAQSLPFVNYSNKDGLESPPIMCIAQDSMGFLWIGTWHGLKRFDGLEFENFYIEEGLRDESITDIYEDRNGYTWIGTDGGGVSCYRSGAFKAYTTDSGLAGNSVSSIVEDHEGNLWFGTDGGVSKFTGKEFIAYTGKDGFPHKRISDMAVDREGNLWLGTGEGLLCFAGNRVISYNAANTKGLINDEVRVLMTARSGDLWIGTATGLCRRRNGVFTWYSMKDGMTDNFVRALFEDKKGNTWIGTESGVDYFSDGGFTNYNIKHGLSGNKVNAVLEDREGNTWFGTNMGLSKLGGLGILNFSPKDGLPHKWIWTITQDRNGNYWFGTDDGLARYSNGTFRIFSIEDGLPSNSIYVLLGDGRGNIWIGTYGGLSVYSPDSGTFRNYTERSGLPHNIVLSLAEAGNGVIWVGTSRGIVRVVDGKIVPAGFKQESQPVHALLIDSKGNLWFSNKRSLCKVSGNQRRCYSTRDGLIHNSIFSLFEDGRGRLWACTEQGLSCFYRGKFTNYTTADGLSDNTCYFALEDDYGNIWIGTRKGVNRFDGQTINIFTARDGLVSSSMNEKACFKDNRGYLWFGTVDGITRFDPGNEQVNSVPPPVHLAALKVFGKNFPLSDNIQLEYDQNYLEFAFTGISLTSPEAVTYRYQLEGMDREWFETRNRYRSYTYLSPGRYVFKVIAKNKDGIESVKPAEIRFRILPPVWQTWWFRMLAGLVLFALMVSVVLWRIKRAKEKTAMLERNKQLVMAQKMELLGVLAGGAVHDLKNLLSIIIGYSKIAVKQAGDTDEKLKPIENIKNTALTAVSVVKQILAFTRQKYDSTLAANLPGLLDDILEILKVNAPPGIKILWEPPKEEIRLFINPTKFQQVAMNLCLNAIQAMEGRNSGELDIRLYKDTDNRVVLRVADTGTGIEPDILKNIFEPLFTTKEPDKGTGLGLFVVKQIIDEYKGKIDVQSNPGVGTTFKIIFPAARDPQCAARDPLNAAR